MPVLANCKIYKNLIKNCRVVRYKTILAGCSVVSDRIGPKFKLTLAMMNDLVIYKHGEDHRVVIPFYSYYSRHSGAANSVVGCRVRLKTKLILAIVVVLVIWKIKEDPFKHEEDRVNEVT